MMDALPARGCPEDNCYFRKVSGGRSPGAQVGSGAAGTIPGLGRPHRPI